MFYCRVLLGDPHYTDTHLRDVRRPPDRPESGGFTYDFVVARPGVRPGVVGHLSQQHHREFIVCASVQVYPEYLITFDV